MKGMRITRASTTGSLNLFQACPRGTALSSFPRRGIWTRVVCAIGEIRVGEEPAVALEAVEGRRSSGGARNSVRSRDDVGDPPGSPATRSPPRRRHSGRPRGPRLGPYAGPDVDLAPAQTSRAPCARRCPAAGSAPDRRGRARIAIAATAEIARTAIFLGMRAGPLRRAAAAASANRIMFTPIAGTMGAFTSKLL